MQCPSLPRPFCSISYLAPALGHHESPKGKSTSQLLPIYLPRHVHGSYKQPSALGWGGEGSPRGGQAQLQLGWKHAWLQEALWAIWEGGTLWLRHACVLSHGLLQELLAVLGVAPAECPLALPTSLQNCIRFGIPTPCLCCLDLFDILAVSHLGNIAVTPPYFCQAGAADTAELLFVTGPLVTTWKIKQVHEAGRCSSLCRTPCSAAAQPT